MYICQYHYNFTLLDFCGSAVLKKVQLTQENWTLGTF